jgi:hypothetical protein
MNKKKFLPSTILSFLTGMLYSKEGFSQTLKPFCDHIIGEEGSTTITVIAAKDDFSKEVLAQLPIELQTEVTTWVHNNDWPNRVEALNKKYGLVEITTLDKTVVKSKLGS